MMTVWNRRFSTAVYSEDPRSLLLSGGLQRGEPQTFYDDDYVPKDVFTNATYPNDDDCLQVGGDAEVFPPTKLIVIPFHLRETPD